MKILVVSREFPPDIIGGMGYHLGYLYSEIADLGHDVTVLAGTCSQSSQAANELLHGDIDVERFSYGTFHAHHLWFPIALRNHLRGVNIVEYDVALTHTHIPFDLGIPTIQKYHDCSREQRPFFRQQLPLPKKYVDSLIDPTRRLVEQRSLRHLDHAIFNSKLCRDAWNDHYEVNPSTTVTHNGVDTDVFYPRDANERDEYILFVGDSIRKGLPAVREYAAKSQEEVLVVGPSKVNDPDITALGRVSQDRLAELYTGAVATIHPAQFEAFGNVVLESLACGTPVVVSDQCGAAEIVDESCGKVTTDISQGIDKVRGIKSDSCIDIAKSLTWNKVAQRTVRTIQDIKKF